VTLQRPGELGSVVIAHKVPNGRDADEPALEMLDAILSSGKTSRLYRALVDQGLALSAESGTDEHRDLSLHTVYAMLAPGATHAQVEQALLKEIARIKSDGVTPEEIARVKQQYLAADAYKRDGTAAVAGELNDWIAVGDWTLYVTFPEKVEQVTVADVQRVARQYLNEDQSTTGWFVPTPKSGEKGS
jgi:zinc protease